MFSRFNKKLGALKNRKRGFTLFEMMVAITIFVLITVIGVLNYSKFGNDIFVTNLAYDIALSIRKAQAYGINVKGTAANSTLYYNTAYGIHFSINSGAEKKQYKIFVDRYGNGPCDTFDLAQTSCKGNGFYDGTQENTEIYTLLKNSSIVNLCTKNLSASPQVTCAQSAFSVPSGNFTSLDATFLRPNPDARIKTSATDANTYVNACIYIVSSDGRPKQIVIYSVGSIAVTDADSTHGCGLPYQS